MFKKFQKGGQFAYEMLVPKVKKNLTKRRADFEDLVKTTDKYTKNLTKEGQISVKKTVAPAAKKISGIHNKYEKRSRKAGGGMMRSRMGLKKGSFPDHSGDGKITKKDILMAKGVIPKPKNKKSKKKVI